jgi:hypothetical protein
MLRADPALQHQYAVYGAGGLADLQRSLREMFLPELFERDHAARAARAEHQRNKEANTARDKSHAFVSGDPAAAGAQVIRPDDIKGKTAKELYKMARELGALEDPNDPVRFER